MSGNLSGVGNSGKLGEINLLQHPVYKTKNVLDYQSYSNTLLGKIKNKTKVNVI